MDSHWSTDPLPGLRGFVWSLRRPGLWQMNGEVDELVSDSMGEARLASVVSPRVPETRRGAVRTAVTTDRPGKGPRLAWRPSRLVGVQERSRSVRRRCGRPACVQVPGVVSVASSVEVTGS